MIRLCLNCNGKIMVTQKMAERGRGKFCSKGCQGKWHFAGKNNPRWNGGKTLHQAGYILIRQPNHPRATYLGYVREHHLIMEKFLGRYLAPWEEIHHINGVKIDNRIENLLLLSSRREHLKLEHGLGTYKDHLNKLNSGGQYV